MKYTSNYNLKKPEGTDIVNIDDLNDNADILDQKLKEVENKADNAPPNSVNDAAIGSRTPDQSQAPASPGTGTLTQLISWLANRIKAITGKTNWWDAPPTTLQAAKTHMDAASPHSGHVLTSDVVTAATANKILKLNADGKLPASITGDAVTVGGKGPGDFAPASHTHAGSDITSAVANAGNADTVDNSHATDFAQSVTTVNSKRAGYAVYAP